MDLRKIIKEEIEKVFDNSNKIVGLDILNHFPFSNLPETAADSNYKTRDVAGWGPVIVPKIGSGDNGQQILSKDDIIGTEFQGPKIMHKFDGYIESFRKKYGEDPIFELHPEEKSSSKRIVIVNKKDDNVDLSNIVY